MTWTALPTGYHTCAGCGHAFRRSQLSRGRCGSCGTVSRATSQSEPVRAGAQHRPAPRAALLERLPPLVWWREARVPFTYAASKNRMWVHTDRGVHYDPASQALRDTLAAQLAGAPVVQAKLWLGVHVDKPDHRGDAVNVVDLVCDAVQDATGLDDRWYALGVLDWGIDRTEPVLSVVIGQEHDSHQAICPCGRLVNVVVPGKRIRTCRCAT